MPERAELSAVRDRNPFEVHCVINRGPEFLGAEAEGEHGCLRLCHREFRSRCLEDIAREFRGEPEHLLPVYHRLPEPVGELHDAVFGSLVADGVEIDRTGHSGDCRKPSSAVLASADLLKHYRHLLFGNHVGRGGDVTPRRGEVDGGIDGLYGLREETQLLILIVRVRNHAGGIDSSKGLVIRVFEFR